MNTPLLSQSEERRAPWNSHDASGTFDVVVTQTLRRETTIQANVPLLYEGRDEDGYGEIEYDTENVDWVSEWSEREYGIQELLQELARRVSEELASVPKDKSARATRRRKSLQHLLDSCQGWNVDETYVEQA